MDVYRTLEPTIERDEIGFELIADLLLDVIERHNLPPAVEDDFVGVLKDERVGAQRPTRRVFFACAN
jgi:hypothetical protein